VTVSITFVESVLKLGENPKPVGKLKPNGEQVTKAGKPEINILALIRQKPAA